MYYCGIDIAMKSSYIYITDSRGRKKSSGEIPTRAGVLRQRLQPCLGGGLAVAIEAGNQTAWIYDLLVELGAEVTVVNPDKVKLIAASRRKTDKVDAKILCELLRLNGLPHPVHVPDKPTQALRGLLVARRQLVSARSKLCNVVRRMLRQEGIQLRPRFLSSFVGWLRLMGRSYAHAHLPIVLEAYHQSVVSLTGRFRYWTSSWPSGKGLCERRESQKFG